MQNSVNFMRRLSSQMVTRDGAWRVYSYFVIAGAAWGGAYTGWQKLEQISREPGLSEEKRKSPIHTGIRGSYQMARLAFAAGLGASIGGITAATAPVSIPAYIYYEQQQNELEELSANAMEIGSDMEGSVKPTL